MLNIIIFNIGRFTFYISSKTNSIRITLTTFCKQSSKVFNIDHARQDVGGASVRHRGYVIRHRGCVN